jgi:hypothetical protein
MGSTDTTTGIDVQAELRMKSSPQLGPTKSQPPLSSQALPIQRAMMNRQQAARSNSTPGLPPPQPASNMMSTGHENVYSHTSPYPRNPSQTPSPSTSRSSAFAIQGSLSSPTSNYPPQQMHQQQQRPPLRPPHRNSLSQHSSLPQSTSGATAAQPISISGKPLTLAQILLIPRPAGHTTSTTWLYEKHFFALTGFSFPYDY